MSRHRASLDSTHEIAERQDDLDLDLDSTRLESLVERERETRRCRAFFTSLSHFDIYARKSGIFWLIHGSRTINFPRRDLFGAHRARFCFMIRRIYVTTHRRCARPTLLKRTWISSRVPGLVLLLSRASSRHKSCSSGSLPLSRTTNSTVRLHEVSTGRRLYMRLR